MSKSTAHLFYGLKITNDKILNKIKEDELEMDNIFGICIPNPDLDDTEVAFLYIKKSYSISKLYSPTSIKSSILIPKKEWHDLLNKWAIENDSPSTISWWLVSNYISI